MIKKQKTIGSLLTRAKQLLPLLAVAGFGVTAAHAQFTPEAVVVESRTGGKNFAAYADSGTSISLNSWANSTAKSTATGTTTGIGSRFNSTAGFAGWFEVSPVLPTAGGAYQVYATVTHASGAISATTAITVTGGSGLPATTTAFSTPGNVWNYIGVLQLDTGVTTPTVRFTESTHNNRLYADAIMFVPYEPCAATDAVEISNENSIKEGDTEITVIGVDAAATSVKVYADGVLVGEKTTGIAAGTNVVTTSALVKKTIISATQTVAGQEGCVPSTGPSVGGGANPSFYLALSVRAAGGNAGPIGAPGGGSGSLYFLGSSAGSLSAGPGNGVVINPNGCWQTVTLNAATDPNFQYTGTTTPLGSSGFVSLDGISFKMNEGDTGPYEIYIDNFQNGSVVLQDWETNDVGETAITFQAPRFSGSTSAGLFASPDISEVSDANADTGHKAIKLSWQFNSDASTRWLRLTADGATPVNRPQLDLSQPITFRILALPVGQSAAEGQIVTHPASGQVAASGNTTLSVVAAGTGNTYQWSKDSNPISGATDSSYSINGAVHGDSGDYTVSVSNATCTKTSTSYVASILVVDPVVITSQPSSAIVAAGNTASFSVEATGGGLSYQWYSDADGAGPTEPVALVDGGRIAGATSTNLLISSTEVADAQSYFVTVQNAAGTETSAMVTLTVNDPGIVTQPLSQSVGEGTNVTFTVEAAGTPALTYQWKKDGGDITGATETSYTIVGATVADSGSYTVEVTNGNLATALSDAAVLTVVVKPTITTQPASASKQLDESVSFFVEASGTAPFNYQWKKNGADITGATDSSYSIAVVGPQDGGDYSVLVSNLAGEELSTSATLTLTGAAFVVNDPQSQTVGAGTNATFTVVAGGDAPISYQWKFNSDDIIGATDASYTVVSASQANAGSYSVAVSNGAGGMTSASATLTVIDPPVITDQPDGTTVDAGQNASFTVAASGTAPFTYQWKKDGADIDGATSDTLNLNNVSLSDAADYTVLVANFAGEALSSVAELVVNAAPEITGQPVSQSVIQGLDATFTVTATGHPLNYQWSFNGDVISGATDSSLTVTDVQGEDLGYYTVVVSNGLGSETSSAASLNISGNVLFADNFDSYADQDAFTNAWPQGVGGGSGTLTTDESVSAPNSVHYPTAAKRNDRSISTTGVTGPDNVISFEFDYYDSDGGAAAYRMYAGIHDGGSSGNSQIIRMGLNNSLTSSYYMAQVLGLNGNAWVRLDDAGAPARSTGWHKLKAVMDGSTIKFYVDGILAKTMTGALPQDYTIVRLGSGLSSGSSANFDNVVVSKAVTPLTITAQPQSATVNAGTTAQLSVTADSATSVSYQWYKDGAKVVGATDATLTINNVLKADEGSYSVVLINGAGPVTSDAATLTVVDPAINTQPQSQAIAAGGNVSFSVVAAGTGTLSYQWKKNDGDISGATDATYSINGVTYDDEADYTVAVTGDHGTVTSDVAALDVQDSATIATQPASISVNQGESASFTVVAGGTAPFTYQWYLGGNEITGATDATYTIPAAAVADAGNYTVEVSNAVGSELSGIATLTVVPDLTKPALKVIAPKNNGIYTDASLMLTGTVLDAVGVASVEYNFNEEGFTSPNTEYVGIKKATNWNSLVELKPGTNSLVVTATDLAGNQTTVGPLRFYYHTVSPLLIQTNLNGETISSNGVGAVVNTISSSLYSGNNTNLFVGRTYTLKALETSLPKGKYILTNWTATWEGQASPVVLQTNNLVCTFEMKSNMVLNANFIDNPFYQYGGTYLGLFGNTNGVAFHNAGYAQIKVTPKMTFSAKLLVDGNAVAVSGKMKIEGNGTATSKARFKATDKPELTVDLTLDFSGGSETIAGTVSQGEDWTSDLLAYRLVWSKTNVLEQAQEFTNSYTMLMHGFTNGTQVSSGTGSGAVKVDVRGKVVISGVGTDMHPVKQATYISRDGHWPLFSPMYKVKRLNALNKLISETRGFTMGWLQFSTNEFGNLRPEGEVHVVKTSWENTLVTPGWTNSVYTEGFTNAVEVQASRWAHDVLAPANTLPGLSRVQVDFTDGDLGSSFSGLWDVTEKVTFAAIKTNTYDNFVKTGLVPKTGVFKGTFVHPSTPELKTKFQGALLQDYQTGEGAFIGTTASGNVSVAPAPLE